MTPGQLDIRANRWAPFVYSIDFEGYDFSAATFAMQVRMFRDGTGAALIDLTNATAGTEGISATVATSGGVDTTTVVIRIDEATLDAVLPYPASGQEPDTDVALRWDIQITPTGGDKARWLEGVFTIAAGVTQ